jgi:hypothetical protein
MLKFISGLITMLFIVSIMNCSGTPTKRVGGMEVIDHSTVVQEKQPCK